MVEDELVKSNGLPSWWWKVCVGILFVCVQYTIYLRRKQPSLFGRHCTPLGWLFGLKKLRAFIEIGIYQRLIHKRKRRSEDDFPLLMDGENRRCLGYGIASDLLRIQAADQKGNSLLICMGYYSKKKELLLQLRLKDGSTFVLPGSPSSLVEECDGNVDAGWNIAGLKYEVVEPTKRFRVAYNGLLKKLDGSNGGQEHHVAFKFIWCASGRKFDARRDWNSGLLSDALARETWKKYEWQHLIKDQGRGFDQWGAARGQIVIDGAEPIDVNLPSLRQRRWGASEADSLLLRAGVVGFAENGLCFYIRASCHPIGLTYSRYGHVRLPNSQIVSVSDCEITAPEMPSKSSPIPQNFLFTLTANGKLYQGNLTMVQENSFMGHFFFTRILSVNFDINGEKGVGMADLWYREDLALPNIRRSKPSYQLCKEPSLDDDTQLLTVSLTDSKCTNSYISGGKGSSLASLTMLHSSNFSVPNGFCVTLQAFKRHIEENTISNLLTTLRLNTADTSSTCKKISQAFDASNLRAELLQDILSRCQGLSFPVAVRSSGCGEDGEESSSAGQNETFLGVSSTEAVVAAIKKCWASAYSETSIQYRIEHGQGIFSDMAVVVQEMVAADKAGVLFTRHPVTGDPRLLYITSNFGLGESVVSGTVEPDTIEVKLSNSGQLEVVLSEVGNKDHKILMTDNGTEEIGLTDAEALHVSLTEEEALRLAQCGLEVQKFYGSSRDIEWAIVDDVIYLLQARPITSGTAWSDYELLHEFDDARMSEIDVLSVANTGEGAGPRIMISWIVLSATTFSRFCPEDVEDPGHLLVNFVAISRKRAKYLGIIAPMADDLNDPLRILHLLKEISEVIPGACSPLCNSILVRAITSEINPVLAISHHHAFIDILSTNLLVPPKSMNITVNILDLALLGAALTTPEMLKSATRRNGVTSVLKQIGSLLDGFKVLIFSSRHAKQAEDLSSKFKIVTEEKSSMYSFPQIAELLRTINRQQNCLKTSVDLHKLTSKASSFSQIFFFSVLAGQAEVLSPENMSDFSSLFASAHKSVSSVVPTALATLADVISLSKFAVEFTELPPQFAVAFIREYIAEAAELWDLFIKQNGHRGWKELDFMSPVWALDNTPVVAALQGQVSQRLANGLSATPSVFKQTDQELLDSFKTPLAPVQRWFLSKFIGICQSAVNRREASKENLIKIVHELRLAYIRLGEMLEQRRILPRKSLIFFLTHNEINQLVFSSASNLVLKASQRMRLYEQWNKLKFPLVMTGLPAPIQEANNVQISNEALRGTSVYPGIVVGTAVVCSTVDDARELTQGDILITRGTDIGWSPYFPMLGGVITELGGLISHGAVVAREYGLPCIIGVPNATKVFVTGDKICLNATKGVVQKYRKESETVHGRLN